MGYPLAAGSEATGVAADPSVFDVLVIGGGISALALTKSLHESDPALRIMLVERTDRLGGKIRTEDFCGKRVDVGPEGFVARTDGVAALCRSAGLEEQLVAPVGAAPMICLGGKLRPIPPGIIGGVVTRPWVAARSGLLSWRGMVRAAWDLVLPSRQPDDDVSIGDLVTERMGREVTDSIVSPLIGGIYAGDVYRMSAAACAPQLGKAMASGKGLVRGSVVGATGGTGGFFTLSSGMATLVERLGQQLEGVGISLGSPAHSLRKTGSTWTLGAGTGSVEARSVFICTPPAQTAVLLAESAPATADCLRQIDSVPVAIVLLAYERAGFERLPVSSGFVVAPSEKTLLTACTFVSAKWPHMTDSAPFIVRCSVGRDQDRRGMELGDPELVAAVDLELRKVAGITTPPMQSRVIRWDSGMIQFRPGHRQLVARARALLPSGLSLLGEGYDGVGLASCVDKAHSAARELLPYTGAASR